MPGSDDPKIYHIVHVDRLPSIVESRCLWSDAEVRRHNLAGTSIGIPGIKERRRAKTLCSHPDLQVGDCVPFYFCPRSVMLYLIYKRNHPSLSYRGGQGPILHLEADLRQTVAWADCKGLRWAITSSNAAASYCEDWNQLNLLDKIDWNAVQATYWQECQERKQAEFLIEKRFPWKLVSRIGVRSSKLERKVRAAIRSSTHEPEVTVLRDWYY